MLSRTSCAVVCALGVIGLVDFAAASDARVRAVHLSPDAPSVDVLVNGGVAFSAVSFPSATGYAALPADTYNIRVVPAGVTEPVVIEADLSLEAGIDYSVLAVNALASIEPLVLIDDHTIDRDRSRVRFVHASPDAPAVDIAVAGGPVLFANVSFREVGDYLTVPAGAYDLEARLAGTSTVVLSVPGVELERATVYTVYAVGFVGGSPELQAFVSVDAQGPARVRAVHASPDAPAVDVLVNGGIAFAEVAFNSATEYAALPADTYQVEVVPAGLTEPVVIDAELALDADVDSSVVAIGTLSRIQPLVLIDDNRTFANRARVRFVHASPNAPAVDIAVTNGPVLFGNVVFGTSGGYIAVPEGVYDLEARLAGTSTVVLSLPGVALDRSTTYSIFATGLVGGEPGLGVLATVDAARCPGDVTNSGLVGIDDVMAILGRWGDGCQFCDEDLDGDGFVDLNDLLLVLANWGPCS